MLSKKSFDNFKFRKKSVEYFAEARHDVIKNSLINKKN